MGLRWPLTALWKWAGCIADRKGVLETPLVSSLARPLLRTVTVTSDQSLNLSVFCKRAVVVGTKCVKQ